MDLKYDGGYRVADALHENLWLVFAWWLMQWISFSNFISI